MLEISKLENEILGSFDLYQNININTDNEALIDLTLIHEECHSIIVSSTSYGEIQYILALLIKVYKNYVATEFIQDLRKSLSQTIKYSIRTHEGFAVWSQIEKGKLWGIQCDVSKLPDLYFKSYLEYNSILDSLSPFLMKFRFDIIKAVAMTAMNTSILKNLKFNLSFSESFNSYISDINNQPDYRMKILIDYLKIIFKKRDLEMEFQNSLKELLSEFEYDFNENIILEINKNPTKDNILIGKKWTLIVQNIIHKYLIKESIPFEIYKLTEIDNQIYDFHSDARSFLNSKFDLDIVDRKRKDDIVDESFGTIGSVEFVPKSNFYTDRIITKFHLNHISKLSSNHSNFILELKRVTKEETNYSYATLLVPIDFKSNSQEQNTKQKLPFNLSQQRIVAIGCLNDLENLVESLNNKIYLLLLEWKTLAINNWNIPNEINTIFKKRNTQPFTVIQNTQGVFFIKNIKKWSEMGNLNGGLIAITSDLSYFYFELENGLSCLTKCSNRYLDLLEEHQSESWRFISKYLSSENKFYSAMVQNENKELIMSVMIILEVDKTGVLYDAY